MFKPENPFQQLATLVTKNDNIVFNEDSSIIGGTRDKIDDNQNITTTLENGVNKITVDNKKFSLEYLKYNKLFLIYGKEDLIDFVSNLHLTIENKIELLNCQSEYNSDDNDIKTSILISIIYFAGYGICEIDSLLEEYFNILLPECYENLINNLSIIIRKIYSCHSVSFLDNYKAFDNLYNFIFLNVNNLKIVLNSDRKLMLELLIYCYSYMTILNFNKIMAILEFNIEFVDCIHNLSFKQKIENAEFKEYFNLE